MAGNGCFTMFAHDTRLRSSSDSVLIDGAKGANRMLKSVRCEHAHKTSLVVAFVASQPPRIHVPYSSLKKRHTGATAEPLVVSLSGASGMRMRTGLSRHDTGRPLPAREKKENPTTSLALV